MRLTDFQIDAITTCFRQFFGNSDHLWLFGSRADDAKKGGDIDLYIETQIDNLSEALELESQLSVCIKMKIGDQKIDIITNLLPLNKKKSIYDEARATGILMI